MSNQLIVVAGATGDLGLRITRALLDRGAEVRVLVRRDTDASKMDALKKLDVHIATVDFANEATLVAACLGAACVVSALNGLRDVIVEAQTALIDAAVEAGVPRFIPSDFAMDFTHVPPGLNRNFDLRREFQEHADAAPIAVTSILNGAFMELLTGQAPIILFKKNRVLYWERAGQHMDFTTKDDVAAFTAAAALDPKTPRKLCIAGDSVSAKELARIMAEVSGKDCQLRRAGSLKMLRGLIWMTRAIKPAKDEFFPVWQGMQYLQNMYAGQGKLEHLDNSRYSDIRFTRVREMLIERKDLWA